MLIRDLMLHLKSLIWCLNKDRERYNLRLIIDSLNACHVPESIQGTPLGGNLNYLIHELKMCGGLQSLVETLKNIRNSKIKINSSLGIIELGQYIQSLKKIDNIPPGSFGVISHLDKMIHGLFYIEGVGLVEKVVSFEQIQVIVGTMI